MLIHSTPLQPIVTRPIVIDANNLIMRSLMSSALEDLRAGGVFTGGVFGAIRSLVSILQMPELRLTSSAIYAFFDGGVPPRRLHFIPEFKAERKKERELLSDEDHAKAMSQLETCRDMFDLLGIVTAKYEEREADDVVAAAVRVLKATGFSPMVISGDHDLYQCVKMGASVWDLTTRRIVDAANFRDVVGISPDTFLLYRALTGDGSDGIKGAGGVGPTRAVEMILDFNQTIDAGSCGGFDIDDYAPLDQLHYLVEWLKEPKVLPAEPVPEGKKPRKPKKPKPLRKFEQAVIDNEERLADVMQGIDLSDSFGPEEVLVPKMLSGKEPNKIEFLRLCKELGLKSFLGAHDEIFSPFQKAWERRQADDALRAEIS